MSSTATITVASANLGNHRFGLISPLSQRRRLRFIVEHADPHVVCIQEAHRALSAPAGYRLIRFPGSPDNPIMIREGLVEDLRGSGSQWVHHGKPGAWAPKWFTWVRIAGIGAIANVHVISGYERNGRPIDIDGTRWPLAFRYNHAVRSWALSHQANATIVAGDTNSDLQDDKRVGYLGFPAQQLGEAGLVDVPYIMGTLGSRTVDRIFYNREHKHVSHLVLERSEPFDHDNPVATFTRRSA